MESNGDPLQPFNRPASIAVVVAIFFVAPAVYLMLPAFVGALADSYGFTETQLGLLASADLAGMALAALTALYWRTRWNWRWVASLALAWVVIGNLITTAVPEFGPLIALRLAVGFGGGLAVAPCLAFLSHTKDPDRVAAIMILFQVGFMVVSFASAPFILGAWGIKGIFVSLAVMTSVLIPFVRLIPSSPPRQTEQAEEQHVTFRMYIPGFIVLLSLALFQVTQSGVWAFVELIGEAAGISDGRVATVLSLTALISLSGPLAAAIWGDRFGRLLPIAVSSLMQLAVIVPLGLGGFGFAAFFVFLSIFTLFWGLSVSYQFGVMAQADATQRLMVLVPTFQAVGVATGPAIVGLGIGAIGFPAVSLIAGSALVLFMALILPFARSGHPGVSEG